MYSSISAKKTATVHEVGISFPPPLIVPMSQRGAVRWEATAGQARGPGGASVSQCDVWTMSTMAYFVFELGCEMGASDKWRKH